MALPKRVQNQLEVLEANVKYWREKYETTLKSADSSRVTISNGLDGRDIPLDERTQIQFNIGSTPYDYVEVHLAKNHDGYSLSVRGGSGITIEPTSGNAVEVNLRD